MMIRRGFVALLSTALFGLVGCRRSGGETSRPKATFGVAPPFSGVDADGRTITLDSLLATGPTVLVFYRGHW